MYKITPAIRSRNYWNVNVATRLSSSVGKCPYRRVPPASLYEHPFVALHHRSPSACPAHLRTPAGRPMLRISFEIDEVARGA